MRLPFLNTQRRERICPSALRRLFQDLADERKLRLAPLFRMLEDPAQIEALRIALFQLTDGLVFLRSLKEQRGAAPIAVATLLRNLEENMAQAIKAQRWPGAARVALAETLETLILAQGEVLPYLRLGDLPSSKGFFSSEGRPCAPSVQELERDQVGRVPIVRRVVIPADLLYQAHHALFPAERMLVIAGRRSGQITTLGSTFDVTGVSNGGHVRADPTKLARALIAMDLSGTYLAAWLHSHPGKGPEATTPSSTDLNQHQKWISDYSPFLVSAIIVGDRWIHFWGTALRNQQIELQVAGPGVSEEDKNENLYRLSE